MGAASSANPKGGLMMSRPHPFSLVGSTWRAEQEFDVDDVADFGKF